MSQQQIVEEVEIDEEIKDVASEQELSQTAESIISIRGGEEGVRLKDFNKTIPSIEQIELIILNEEREQAEAEARAKAELLMEQQKLAEAAEGDVKIETEEVEKIVEEKLDEDDEDEEDIEDVEEVAEEEEQIADDFDKIKDEEPEVVQDEMVFTGFDEEDIKRGESDESLAEEVSIVFTIDPRPIIIDIIWKVVEKCEHKNKDAVLREKLDPKKLMNSIRSIWPKLHRETKKCTLLNRKCIEYFRKKKSEKGLAEDNPETLTDEMLTFHEILEKVDDIKARKAILTEDVELKMKQLIDEKQALRQQYEGGAELLTELLKQTGAICFSKKTGTYLSEKTINFLSRKIIYLRDQISQLRLALIKAQHRMAFLVEKARKLEDIGGGLRQADFERLKAETQGLEEKIDARANELIKLRNRCYCDTNVLSHSREKMAILQKTVAKQDQFLNDLYEDQLSTRNYLHDVNVNRDQLRFKYQTMSLDCGLLDKPVLLYDYDETNDKVNETEKRVQILKEEKAKLTEKLQITVSKLK